MKGKGGVDMGKPPPVVPRETLRAYPRPPANPIVDSAQNVVIEEEKTPYIGNIILEEMCTQYRYIYIYIYKYIYIYVYVFRTPRLQSSRTKTALKNSPQLLIQVSGINI